MHRALRIGLVAVLAGQAGHGLWQSCHLAWSRGTDYAECLSATTERRIALLLGADAPVYRHIVDVVPAGSIVVAHRPPDATVTAADHPRIRLANLLRHIVNPERFLLILYEPVTLAEGAVRNVGEVWLLVLPGDPLPAGRPGWTRELDVPGACSLWVLRT